MKHKVEPVEVMVARIDERVEQIHRDLPAVRKQLQRHDRELLVGKVLLVLVGLIAAVKFPAIADAIGKVILQ